MDDAIGGYFSLELGHINNMPNKNGIMLNSGRNSLEYILRSIQNITCLYIPYFTCEVVLEPIKKLNINFKFYQINEQLEIKDKFLLKDSEYILYTNYFGIKDEYIYSLVKLYGDKLIVDNAQALFAKSTVNCIYSPRKFVGVPDGGIAFSEKSFDRKNLKNDTSYHRFTHLIKRIDIDASSAYKDFQESDNQLINQDIQLMSNLTKRLLESINFDSVKTIRRNNYLYLNEHLSKFNKLKLPDISSFECPMVYPYYIENGDILRKKLIANKIFIATYWLNVFEWCPESSLEYVYAKNILPLPIDQRYAIKDLDKYLNIIIK